MKLIITGCAGFIGSNFLYYYLNKYPDYKIVGYDLLTYAGNINTLNTALNNPKFKFIKGDISDKKAVDSMFSIERPDIVINFAAESHVDRSICEPERFLITNVIGTQILLDACYNYNISRFHQVSTDEVYGDLPIEAKSLKFTEKLHLHPSSPYSVSKASADLLVLSYFRTYRLPVTISRCSNNYGPYQHTEKLIPLMIINALDNKRLPVYGNGKNVRDWIYVEDHCKAIDLIIHNGRMGEIYNIGGDCEMQNIDVVRMILEEVGKPESLIRYVDDRVGHDLRYAIDFNKIHSELGWENQIHFVPGLKKTVQWYKDNIKWCEYFLDAHTRK
jgi:dTDP-glucose 4,6-dehydratase